MLSPLPLFCGFAGSVEAVSAGVGGVAGSVNAGLLGKKSRAATTKAKPAVVLHLVGLFIFKRALLQCLGAEFWCVGKFKGGQKGP